MHKMMNFTALARSAGEGARSRLEGFGRGRDTKVDKAWGRWECQKMLHWSVNTARVCGAGIALSCLLSGGAYAADVLTKAPPVPYVTDDIWTRPYLLGDLGRTRLKEQGVELSLQFGDEAVGNLTGGN